MIRLRRVRSSVDERRLERMTSQATGAGTITDDEPSGIRVGHVHLRVSNLDRSLAFYRDVVGLEVFARADPFVFLGADGYHHHVALNTVQSEGGQSPPAGSTGSTT
jgi:catechol 2,3-dioxygenase